MKRSYRIKDSVFPVLLPVVVPTVMVPASFVAAWSIHLCQGARFAWLHHRRRQTTPTSVPDGAGGQLRTQDEAVAKLPLQEFRPLPIDGYTATGLRGVPDIAPMFFDSGRLLRGRFHRYPHHFHETLIPVGGGIPISGIMGLHHSKLPRPGLIIVHGLMNSKRQDLVRIVTMRAFYEWGFNVCAVDLRGFGRSAESVSVPTGAGGIEAGDVIEVAKYLRKFPHFTSIGALGFSLGGGAVINAAGHREADKLLDGGVMAISPPINFERALNRFEERPEDEEHLMTYHFFRYLLKRMLNHSELMRWVRKRLEKEGGDPNISGFNDYLRNLVAWGYLGHGRRRVHDPDVLVQALMRLSSPRRALSKLRVPTFILHAKDDPLCQISEEDIALMNRVAAESPLLRHCITERGGHAAYVVVNPTWFYDVVRTYFTYWGRWTAVKRHPFEVSSMTDDTPAANAARDVLSTAAAAAANVLG